MKRSYWTGMSTHERTQAMTEITAIVDRHAIILNFQRFSDVSLSLMLEVEECRVRALYEELRSVALVDGLEEEMSDSTRECLVFVNITFADGTGNMQIEVPDIPG
jgi:hypothetical protein